ncbi:MAG: DEAD/DEAH box helicase family protein [Burkholderiales bacterium]|nr:DEAD/DEAH box helicase family protein [Burkholderiales bacterium]
MALTLKAYQENALKTLDTFLDGARGASTQAALQGAFDAARRLGFGESSRPAPYRVLESSMPEVPLACIRIPTGGGKTLLAAHAIEIAAQRYVGTTTPVVLWLVPTEAIRSQTIDALKKPGHDYREALLQHYPADRLTVLDIGECEQLRAQDFGGRAIVIVATIQTLRVDETAKRDVYAYKEAFEPHFAVISDEPFLERIGEADLAEQPYLNRSDLGKVKRSLANLLAWYRPIVMVDEAHNAQTDLSLEVMKRVRPACVIEWTATPARTQNVLFHVSAQALKAENMIKLPIVLSPHPNWQEAVRDAVLTRERLADAARSESDYVRPIVLFQADNVNGEVPVEKLKQHLMEAHRIEERRIAVATGSQRELEGVNLFDRTSPIEFVITVQALKEGWDCSFAYVFCTVQRIRSATALEQLLGRVLRLPYARPRTDERLGRAYAHVSADVTAQVANELTDKLVAMGFEEMEAVVSVVQPEPGDLFGDSPQEPATIVTTIEVSGKTARQLQEAAPDVVGVQALDSGATVVTISGDIPPALRDSVTNIRNAKERAVVEQQIDRHLARVLTATAPSQRGAIFAAVPQVCALIQGELMLVDGDLIGEIADYSLAGQPVDLPNFTEANEDRAYLIDIERGKLRIEQDRQAYLVDLDSAVGGIRREDVIKALADKLADGTIVRSDMVVWIGKALDELEQRNISLTYCARHINRLADALRDRLREILVSGKAQVFRRTLFGEHAIARLDDHHQFRFGPLYPASWFYGGRYRFQKHFYPAPGELDDDPLAEETACAIAMDELGAVKHWVRNLERQPESSFWLPTSSDRFYPDFVAELDDGRLLVVEYKGAHLFDNNDSKEKRDVGATWARLSENHCIFLMATHAGKAGSSVAEQIRKAITAK